jgi:fructokinase
MIGKILCIGEALIDMICTDKGQTLSQGNHFLKKPGGAPTNVAAAIAALGGSVTLAAKVGNDPFGQQLISVMEGFGVDTRWMLRDKEHFTTLAFVSLMENGERDFVFSRGADGQLSEADVNDIDLDEFSIVHFGSATGFLPGPLQLSYRTLQQKAKAANRFISFDPNYRHLLFPDSNDSFIAQSLVFIAESDFIKLSDEEALLITGAATIEEAATQLFRHTEGVFAITIGKEGTLLGYRQQLHTVPSIAVNPIDTTGAGDAFVGAVLYQLSHYNKTDMEALTLTDWIRITTNANKAGARTCEYLGAMEAFAHLNNQIFN